MKSTAYFFLILILLSSCISNKRITYLQNLPGNEEIGLDEFIPYANVDYKYILQAFDIVDIDFASSDSELTEAFEFQGSRNMRGGGIMGGAGGGGDMFFFTGYTIDEQGFIELPKLGKIKIASLTEEEAKDKVQVAINEYFKEDVFVKLRVAGIRYTTLGEFGSSGTKVILRNRATIFDALAASGESNILAKRNRLFIIRQYDGGTKIHQINLHDRALLASPYFFIQNNDILYLEPMKIRQLGNSDNLASGLQLFGTFLASGLLIFGLLRGNF
ncbi:periplasmic protein involved in polysaccharide export [Belliella baltica DSM 15883]|uniref:Periplasmic protein involved in polysaccharide export n=1 Tax=Belliella baltica (strain DSM 15883 / CIP 108006 / LMG 21964 / BA134) TaxID=866536 RepID=I3Z9F0_BELBD|nr:polysaccharide biosynthesis/export family protein [Belliella baltica]AFL85868.1 periplasmic protein involved in polysaccharide export [Belliella baltica DSM 15883]